MQYQLSLKEMHLMVKLGHFAQERIKPQQVLVDIRIDFLQSLKACQTDDLNDTLCYARLQQALQAFCDAHCFKLIEYLGQQLFQFLKQKIQREIQQPICLSLSVAKISPINAIPKAIFTICDKN